MLGPGGRAAVVGFSGEGDRERRRFHLLRAWGKGYMNLRGDKKKVGAADLLQATDARERLRLRNSRGAGPMDFIELFAWEVLGDPDSMDAWRALIDADGFCDTWTMDPHSLQPGVPKFYIGMWEDPKKTVAIGGVPGSIGVPGG